MPQTRVTAVGEGTSLHDRKVRAGQRLVVGFEHPHVDDDLRCLIREIRPAGFILFKRNLEDLDQIRELNRELHALCDAHLPGLISVDQEGGLVQRVREPATVWPPMREVGNCGDLTADVAAALARELRALGFDLDFAPVADVDSNPHNPVIGNRSFGRDPHEVARHVATFVRAMQAEGIVACAKHFPGHGDTHLDSHHDLPVVEEEEPRLRSRELVPFRAAIEAGVGTVMTAHVIFPAFDEELPATLSPRVVPRLLRGELAYDGVVFTDALEMKAIDGRWDLDTVVRAVTRAEVDVLLLGKPGEMPFDVFRALVHAQEDDVGFEKASETSAARVHRLRQRFLLDRPPAPALTEVGSLPFRMLAETVRQRGGEG
jgi:beta-N-acetylhexosaminidase